MSDDACELLCIDLDHAEALRAVLPAVAASAVTAERMKALGDPTRLRITQALHAGGELCVCDLAWVVGASQGLVSHHLRALRTAGLVEPRRDGKLVMYRVTEPAVRLLTAAGVMA